MYATTHGGVCTDIIRECALKVDSGRKIPCCTGKSNLRVPCAGLMLSQLSHILAYILSTCVESTNLSLCCYVLASGQIMVATLPSFCIKYLSFWFPGAALMIGMASLNPTHGGVCTDIIRECARKVDAGRKIPCCTRKSNLRVRCAGLMLCQLSHILAYILSTCVESTSLSVCFYVLASGPIMVATLPSFCVKYLSFWFPGAALMIGMASLNPFTVTLSYQKSHMIQPTN